MGFVIRTAEERNPTTKQPTAEENKIATLEAELKRHNDFLEENGLAIKFDMWKDIKDGIAENVKAIHEAEAKQAGEYIEFEELSMDDVASLENEK